MKADRADKELSVKVSLRSKKLCEKYAAAGSAAKRVVRQAHKLIVVLGVRAQTANRDRHTTVSYTHLDVYKRQAQNVLANLITIFLGITIATKMQADQFLSVGTLMIMCLGLFAFVFDTVGGVLFAKLINVFSKTKINPMIGACGISAFPMSSRVIHKMGLKEDPQNFLLMHAAGVNVGGQIASVIAGGLLLNLIAK